MKTLFMHAVAFFAFAVLALPLMAQTATPPAAPTASTFSVSASVVGLTGSSTQAATDAGARFAVTNNLEIGTDNYIGADYHSHFGTISYQLPFLSKQLNKTNLDGNSFRFGIKGGAGVVFPSTGNQRMAGLAGGWFQYAPSGNKKFALEGGADWISVQPHTVVVRFGPVLTF